MNHTRLKTNKRFLGLFFLSCLICAPGQGQSGTPQSEAASPNDTGPSKQSENVAKVNPSSSGGMKRASPLVSTMLLLVASMRSSELANKQIISTPKVNQSPRSETETERFVRKSVEEGRVADLTGRKDRVLSAKFLSSLLFFTAASTAPSKAIYIRGAVVDGKVVPPTGSFRVPNILTLNDCEFRDQVILAHGRFEQSVAFIDVAFRKGLDFSNASIQGDLVMLRGSVVATGGQPDISLASAQIGGELYMSSIEAKNIAALALKAKTVEIILDKSVINKLDLSLATVDMVRIFGLEDKSQNRLDFLNLQQALISGDLWLARLQLKDVNTFGMHVTGNTEFGPELNIEDKLDLTGTHHGYLSWTLASQWPSKILASGLSFDELGINSGKDNGDLNVEFLRVAQSSESGLLAYEQILRNRGQLTEADAVYSLMREKRRSEARLNSNGNVLSELNAAIFSALDKGQAIFLGYGRFPLPPLLWSAMFVLLGVVVFRDQNKMDPTKDNAQDLSTASDSQANPTDKGRSVQAAYSRFWYSLELFLPVVDLGVAKNWRPKTSQRSLRTYARVHQLAGWILIPVSLAALTGAVK